jgi:hypothetical protein
MSDKKEKTLEQQLEDAQARLQGNELKVSKLREKLLKQDARKAQILTKVFDKWIPEDQEFAAELHRRMSEELKTDSDRKLFGFDPLPKKEDLDLDQAL